MANHLGGGRILLSLHVAKGVTAPALWQHREHDARPLAEQRVKAQNKIGGSLHLLRCGPSSSSRGACCLGDGLCCSLGPTSMSALSEHVN